MGPGECPPRHHSCQNKDVCAPVTAVEPCPRRDHTLLHFVAREVARHCGDAAPGLRAALPSAPAAARTSTAALQARRMGPGNAPDRARVLSCGRPASSAASLTGDPCCMVRQVPAAARILEAADTHGLAQACDWEAEHAQLWAARVCARGVRCVGLWRR